MPETAVRGHAKTVPPITRNTSASTAWTADGIRFQQERVSFGSSGDSALVSLKHQRYRFSRILVVEVKHTPGGVTVLNQQYDAYGAGPQLQDAVEDLRDMLVETYEELLESEPYLSRYLRGRLSALRELIRPI